MRPLTMSALGAASLATVLVRAAMPERAVRPLAAALTGQDAVPDPGDLDGSGTARVHLDVDRGEICFDLAVAGIAPAVAAHIHEGASGHAGRALITLMPPTGGSSSGCVSADGAILRALLDDPAGHYVSVRTADFPGGALRGQLSR